MALKSGIIGLPNVGKSLLFNTLSNKCVPTENFPFCTIDPNVSIVNLPDERLKQLADIVNPLRVQPATMTFVDIAGLVEGASQGEGLGNQFLAHIREVDQLVHVVRCFENASITHVTGGTDPAFDKCIIDHELQLKDLSTLVKRKEKLKKAKDDGAILERELVDYYMKTLEEGKNARDVSTTPQSLPVVTGWQLLTQKPVMYVANVDECTLGKGDNLYVQELKKVIEKEHAPLVALSIPLEARLAVLDAKAKKEQISKYKLGGTSIEKLIRTSYELLNLITYFTAGSQEVRAWTIPKYSLAPQAAGVIHTDLEKNFIRAQVVKIADYLYYKGEKNCKQAGKVSLQGKKYSVEDGDVIHFITS